MMLMERNDSPCTLVLVCIQTPSDSDHKKRGRGGGQTRSRRAYQAFYTIKAEVLANTDVR